MSVKLIKLIDILTYSSELLKKKGIKDSRLNAELLMCNALNYKRIQLYLDYDKPLNEKEVFVFKNQLRRRLNGEPIQYILGKSNFFGLEIHITNDVLIPRPDTEVLVEKVLEKIIADRTENIRILEIGCGSGCISLALATEFRRRNIPFQIKSIDVSESAVNVARRNQIMLDMSEFNLNFEKSDVFELYSFDGYDYVVSNPPYISLTEYSELEDEVKNYEPKLSLTDEEDGLKIFKRICDLIKISNSGLKVFCEIGYKQSNDIKEILEDNGLINFKFHKDLNNINRVIEIEK